MNIEEQIQMYKNGTSATEIAGKIASILYENAKLYLPRKKRIYEMEFKNHE